MEQRTKKPVILGERFGARHDAFPTSLRSVLEPQNPQDHRVDRVRTSMNKRVLYAGEMASATTAWA